MKSPCGKDKPGGVTAHRRRLLIRDLDVIVARYGGEEPFEREIAMVEKVAEAARLNRERDKRNLSRCRSSKTFLPRNMRFRLGGQG
jgi:hypothetical protein